MITKLPIDVIKVDSSDPGYVLYDVVQNKLIVSTASNNIGAIKRSGDTLTAPIYSNVETVDPNQFVSQQYVQFLVDKIMAEIPKYLQKTGGQMTGPILVANTSVDEQAMVTKGQATSKMDPDKFIKVTGGTMLEAFNLHSNTVSDYGPYHAVPKFLVDKMIDDGLATFSADFEHKYLSVNGGKMRGPLYKEATVEPYLPNHCLSFGDLKRIVQQYIRSTDWSCTKNVGQDVKQCATT